MGYSFIWAAFLIFSLASFRLFYAIKGFERGYLGLYKGIAMVSVICFDPSGNSDIPFFQKSIFAAELDAYLEENIEPYTTSCSYQISWKRVAPYPLLPESNQAKVAFTFALPAVGTFSRELVYTIKESPYE